MAAKAKRAAVIGAGPNGLAAAVALARAGLAVEVFERAASVGGGASSAALTLPGFMHDVCSAVHPMAAVSPAFLSMPLEKHGLRWIAPPAALAHPLDGLPAAILENSVEATAAGLGGDAGTAWRNILGPLAARADELLPELLAPPRFPRKPLLLARFGSVALPSASNIARRKFRDPRAQALFGGCAAHSARPLDAAGSSAIGWALLVAGAKAGWPIPEGGSQRIADALASYLRSLGGTIRLNAEVRSLDELGDADVIVADTGPAALARLAGPRLPEPFRRKLEAWRYGPGTFKLDWALSGPIPWSDPACARAGTVHVGGTLEELEAAERAPWKGRAPERPFVLVAQPSLFDPSRAPAGRHTAWAYARVPNGSAEDMTERIEAQLERFAPGFKSRVLARHAMGPAALAARNPNLVGGDITGGAQDLLHLFLRPTRRLHRTPSRGLYLCSASTPPGAGVHGMGGWHAAAAALKDLGLPLPA